jgi:hypothetical protein
MKAALAMLSVLSLIGAGSVAVADDGDYTVKVKVGGMS